MSEDQIISKAMREFKIENPDAWFKKKDDGIEIFTPYNSFWIQYLSIFLSHPDIKNLIQFLKDEFPELMG